jgi:hypothetical protein
VYSYFVSNPSELRHAVREDLQGYLTKTEEEIMAEEAKEDTRPIEEQLPDLMGDWAALESELS